MKQISLRITMWKSKYPVGSAKIHIQNEDGMWPTSGTFTFSAEPEDGYELADGCAPLCSGSRGER